MGKKNGQKHTRTKSRDGKGQTEGQKRHKGYGLRRAYKRGREASEGSLRNLGSLKTLESLGVLGWRVSGIGNFLYICGCGYSSHEKFRSLDGFSNHIF